MTYLQIVNSVLRKLRKDEVTSVSSTTYSSLIGDLVNVVKDEVEQAWKWNALRSTITINTVDGTFRYVLTGAGSQSVLLDIWNDTEDSRLRRADAEYLNSLFIDSPTSGSPDKYGVNGVDSSGDMQLDLYPIPDGVYDIDVNLILKQDDLSADTDTPTVPANVLVLGAWALAISERGEDGGAMFNEVDTKYRSALSDAIAIDAANMHTNEITWCTE